MARLKIIQIILKLQQPRERPTDNQIEEYSWAREGLESRWWWFEQIIVAESETDKGGETNNHCHGSVPFG